MKSRRQTPLPAAEYCGTRGRSMDWSSQRRLQSLAFPVFGFVDTVIAVDTKLSLPRGHFLSGLAKHVPAGLLVERLLDEFSDCKPRLHLGPRAYLRVPALDVGIIVEREALRLVGHGPGKARDVGDGIVARHIGTGLAELSVEHSIKPGSLVAVAFDGVGNFF